MRSRRMAVATALFVVIGMAGAVYSAEDRKASPLEESYRLQAAGDYAGAASAMREAVESTSRSYFPRLRLAYLQLMSADYAAAAESYRLAALMEPNAVEPLLGQQQCLMALERWDQAEAVGKDLWGKDPKNYLGLSRLAWTQRCRGDFKTAVETYRRVLALYPGDVDMRLGLGFSLLGAGKKTDASATFREVLAMVPGHKDAVAGLKGCD